MTLRLARLDRRAAPVRFLPEIGICLTGQEGRAVVATRSRAIETDGQAWNSLPRNGIWLTDLPFGELTESWPGSLGGHVRSDGWIGLEWRQILAEWGLRMPIEGRQARALAAMMNRVVAMGISAAETLGCRPRAEIDSAELLVSRQQSLSSVLRVFIRGRLESTRPVQLALHEASRDLHLFGISGVSARGLDRRLAFTFVRSRVAHASMLAGSGTPSPGAWQRVELQDPPVVLSCELLSELEGLNRPVIVSGGFQPFTLVLPSWVRSWLAGYSGGFGRQSFILEEVRLLRSYGEFCIRDAFVGPGWRQPSASLLTGFVAGLGSACGKARIARLSWSAGLAAENLFHALAGRPEEFDRSFSFESGWVAAQDRIAAVPAIQAAEACGAVLVRSQGSQLCLAVRDSREAILELIRSLWKLGWWPAGGLRGTLAELVGGPGEFGGGSEDWSIAIVMRDGLDGIAGALDRLHGRPARLRREQEKLLLGQLRKLAGGEP